MPLLWKELLRRYFTTLALCVGSFLALLLTLRLKQVADLAATTNQIADLLLFIAYLIPYALPLALPIGALVATLLLASQLSEHGELTAWRATGMATHTLLAPLLLAALLLAGLNFYVSSELATHCHQLGIRLQKGNQRRSPLRLLQSPHLLRMGEITSVMGRRKGESVCYDLALCRRHPRRESLELLFIKKLSTHADELSLDGVTYMTHRPQGLFVLQEQEIAIPEITWRSFSAFSSFHPKPSHLPLRPLLHRIHDLSAKAQEQGVDPKTASEAKRQANKSRAEFIRRLSLSLALFTFTLLGWSYGIRLGRHMTLAPLLLCGGWSAFIIATFCLGHGLGHRFLTSIALFILPQLAATATALLRLRAYERGRIRCH